MKKIYFYIGPIIQLIGVLVMAIPAFNKETTNSSLLIGVVLVIVGFFVHILLGRKYHP